ncbi:MAG: hypothetical protein PHX76_03115 [Patescibacteria group bacterium]|jgi:tRNA G10  N-methylase Trm11|nr:hypothetical protein [Patescibacteria group bacterium]MDD3939609.1 hypothetical protein [Patescibacteria group bacterium]MDD4443670.1 hypothetical protein [Patescibacteria group bacterium]
MKYFFILGNNPALSLAEVLAVIKPKSYILISEEFLVTETSADLNPLTLSTVLGGTIKIGLIKEELAISSYKNKIEESILQIIRDRQKEVASGKFNFGFSNYSNLDFGHLGLKIKKDLSSLKINTRFVVSREKTLSSVIVEQNKLLRKGVEIVFARYEDYVILGETMAVQPFKSLSYRDFSRPARDDKSGMLPPKLAKIMINLAEADKDGLLVDPFCGSGTILSEAILMGYNNLYGLDLSSKAIDDSFKNINWIKEQYQIEPVSIKFKVKNVLDLSKFIKVNSVSAFISEPYLGPQRGKIEFKSVIKEIEYLYTKALVQMYQVLEKGGRVVMVWPVFYGNKFVNPNIGEFKKISILPDNLKNEEIKKRINQRGNIVYGRAGQKVFREVIVLEK